MSSSGRSNSLISSSWRKESVTIIEQTEPDETKEEEEKNKEEDFPSGLPPLAPEMTTQKDQEPVKDTLKVSFNPKRRSSAPGTADKFLAVPKQQMTASSSAETLTGDQQSSLYITIIRVMNMNAFS